MKFGIVASGYSFDDWTIFRGEMISRLMTIREILRRKGSIYFITKFSQTKFGTIAIRLPLDDGPIFLETILQN